MIGLITIKNPQASAKVSGKSIPVGGNFPSGKKSLVAKWLLDDHGHLYCQWVKQ